MTWWLGDLAGALVITPVIVLWMETPAPPRELLLRSMPIIATTIAAGTVAFSPLFEQTANRAALAFLAILPLMWAALRGGQRDTATVSIILACFAVWGTTLQSGPFGRSNMNESYLLVLAFMISISVPSLALSADVAMRKLAMKQLDSSNKELVEHARALNLANVLLRNVDDEITLWTEGARRLYGWTKEEAVGQVSHQLLRTEFPLPLEVIKQHLFQNGSWDGELVQCTKSGEQLFCQSHWELYNAADGSPNVILETSTDISDRKRYEEHFQFIMRELSHRSKNLLAVIQSIARQIALGTNTFAEFQEAFSARIDALVKIHNLLVAGAWHGVEIHDLIRTQLSPFTTLSEDRLETSGPSLTLKPMAAEQIGLALHELATNAAKHGAYSDSVGRVQVRWDLQGADAGTLRLSWREYSGRPVRSPERRGFGHLVITKAVPASLQGKVLLEFRETGVHWIFEAPATNVVAGPDALSKHSDTGAGFRVT
jgi:PAS domain S-box-containing protein